MSAYTKRRLQHLVGSDLTLISRTFVKRHRHGFEIAVLVSSSGCIAEIWSRDDDNPKLWERLGRHPIDRPTNRLSLLRQVEEFLV